MAQLELQQKSLQAQNEILSKVGWATASDKGLSYWGLGASCQGGRNLLQAVGTGWVHVQAGTASLLKGRL